MGKRDVWTEEQKSYVRKAFEAKASRTSIVKGLKEEFNSIRTEAAVGALINKLRHGNDNPKPGKSGRRNFVRKASAKSVDEIRKSSKAIILDIPEVERLKSIRKGQLAYHPECGVVISYGITNIDGYGEVVHLEEVYPLKSAKRFMTPKHKIESKNMRMVHSKATMENILRFLASDPDIPNISGRTKDKVDYMQALLRDSSIKSQIEAVLRVYSDKSPSKGSYLELGMDALHRLSGEYAAATGTDFKVSEQRFRQALGLKTAAQLAVQYPSTEWAPA